MSGIQMNGTKVAVFGCLACVVAFVFGGLIGFVLGDVRGTVRAYHARFDQEAVALTGILESHPQFGEVSVDMTSQGLATFVGRVNSEAQLEELKAAVVEQLGHHAIDKRIAAVDIRRTGE